MTPLIPLPLHDSLIVAAEFGLRRELNLTIELNPTDIAKRRTAVLRFGGIHNVEAVSTAASEIRTLFSQSNGLAWRIERFDYDESRVSTANDLYFLLEIDHLKPLEIHCMKMSMLEAYDT